MKLTQADAVDKVVAEICKHADKTPQVMIGPIVQLNGQHYFIVATAKAGKFWCFQLKIDPKADCEIIHDALIGALTLRKPIVIQSFDDELTMARWCAGVWPCPKTRRIRDAIIEERAATP